MTNASESSASGADPRRDDGQAHGLRTGAIGLVGLATLGAVMMSPAIGIYGNWGPMALLVGRPTPFVFLAALLASIPTAACYAMICREMPVAGSVFSWVSKTINPTAGGWSGLMMITYYTVTVTVQPIFFGLFFNSLLRYVRVKHVGLGTWTIGVVLITAIVTLVAYRGIHLSARVAVTMILIETGILTILCITIIVTKVHDGDFTWAPLDPSQIHGGGSALWTGMILGIVSFTGFDVISTVAEEAKAPRRLLPKATILACVGVGLFWAFGSFAFSIAEPPSRIDSLASSGLTPATTIAQDYLGGGRILVIVTALTALSATYLATAIGASRGVYAMSREGLLPKRLGHISSRRGVPSTAMTLVFSVATLGLFMVTYALHNEIDSVVWWSSAIVFFALLTYVGANLACLVYFVRFARDRFNWFLHLFVPVLGIGIDSLLIYKSFFHGLWGTGWRLGGSVMPVCLALAAAALGGSLLARKRRSRPAATPSAPSSDRGAQSPLSPR